MESGGLINPNLVTFFLTLVNIGTLCFILRAILFKPVTRFMEARSKKIQDTVDQTERDKSQAKQLLERYEEKLQEAGAEAEAIIKGAREEAEVEAARIIAEGKDAAQAFALSARRQLEDERQAALTKFRAEAAGLVIAASSKLVAREFSGGDNARYAKMLLDELAAQKGVANVS
ncbi:MAG: ATP synthase F0 subunit B [Treponema sp.]|jgi:F-type H+-transporting ATPase subunit b|nr:ATP synthase F0 subunit B [Treponema sp.]